MNTRELETKTKEIRADIDQLQKTFAELHAEELTENPQEIGKGFRFNLDTDLFNEAERELATRIEALTVELMDLQGDISETLYNIRNAKHQSEAYDNTLIEGVSKGYSDAQDFTAETLRLSSEAKDRIEEIASQIQTVAYNRYFKRLSKKKVLSEIGAISKSFYIIENEEETESQLAKLFNFNDANLTNLIARYRNDYYRMTCNAVLFTSFESISDEGQKDYILKIISPYFERHLNELSEADREKAEAIIDKLAKRLLNEYTAPKKASQIQAESFFTSQADNFYFYKDKVSNQLTLLEAGKERPLATESDKDRKKGKEITTLVTLNFDELSTADSNIRLSAPILDRIDDYDREVINAVFTAWQSAELNGEIVDGEAVTTLQTIYRYMTKNKVSTLTEETEQDLTARLVKLTAGIIKINAKAEAVYYKQLADFEKTGALMSIVIDKAYVNGNLVENAVHIIRLDKSPLHLYAKIKGQIGTVELKNLDTKAVNKSKEMIVIEGYLIRRIEAMDSISNIILIDTLFNEVGIFEKDFKDFKSKKKTVIKKIKALLEGYVKTGYIKGYTFNSKGRSKYYSITIKK